MRIALARLVTSHHRIPFASSVHNVLRANILSLVRSRLIAAADASSSDSAQLVDGRIMKRKKKSLDGTWENIECFVRVVINQKQYRKIV